MIWSLAVRFKSKCWGHLNFGLKFFYKIFRTVSAGKSLPDSISEVPSFSNFSIQHTCVSSFCLLHFHSVYWCSTLNKKYWD